ncbi:MAG: hypothetical protein BroJett029_20230 [Alphaproteobacteria bacterium]|nr:MAG: hypothetical protein BroJett029_20230 [Alphaproteobacteria bacterium]
MSKSRPKPETAGPPGASGSRTDAPVTVSNVLPFAALAGKRKPRVRVEIAPQPDDVDPGPGAA